MSSAVLTALSLSIIAFEMSCSKSANAQTSGNGLTQLNKIVYTVNVNNSNQQIWIANYDGSNPKQVPIPSNLIVNGGIKLSPDGKTIFFSPIVSNNGAPVSAGIYSCGIDGSNLTKVVSSGYLESAN